MMKQRFEYIDALRGIAILGVIITHAAGLAALTGISKMFTSIGGFGVQLFFVISAFTIFYSLSRDNNNPSQIRDFFIKRLFRIVPVYWMGILLYTAVYGIGSRGWREAPELWHYPVHMFLLNVLYPTTSSSVVPGGWSISCEVLFYMTVPLFYFYLKGKNKIIMFMVGFVLLYPYLNSFLSRHLSPILFPLIELGLINEFWYRWLPNQLGCFGFGIVLFNLLKNKNFINVLTSWKVNLSVTIVTIAGIFAGIYIVPYKFVHFFYAFSFMCLALCLSFFPWKVLVNWFTKLMGKISFSCYLVHFIVLQKGFTAIQKLCPSILITNKNIVFSMLVFGGIAITAPLAYLSYRLIELPSVKLGKNFMSYLNTKKSVAEKIKESTLT